MAYATVTDVQNRMTGDIPSQAICTTLLDDAGVMIDSINSDASAEVKKIVSCKMVIRAIGSSDVGMPIGTSQGTMSALGYSQTWTMQNGSTGELYLTKAEKQLLGAGNKIGVRNPLEDLT